MADIDTMLGLAVDRHPGSGLDAIKQAIKQVVGMRVLASHCPGRESLDAHGRSLRYGTAKAFCMQVPRGGDHA